MAELQHWCFNLCCGSCADCCGSCWSITTCGCGSKYICYDLLAIGTPPEDWNEVKTAARPGDPGYVDPKNPLKVGASGEDGDLADANALPLLPLSMDREVE